ncbi:carbohydrate ABC transporter permease [Fodinicola acaciae]|uniref:carbohydrate ABC transporter permease n=1 Tax=Fodinicola acaciae TaxID=2681555 RepID=UPI001C9E749A|nr:sugar ABC transporter permease [Fodinicola acaciae]
MRRLTFAGGMLSPGVILLAALSIIPTVALLAMSFAHVRLIGGARLEWAGLTNWARVFTDGDVWRSWGTTVLYLVLTLGLEMLLGVALALGLFRLVRGRGALLSMLLLPMFVAPVIVGLLGRFLTDSTFGLYARILQAVGLGGDIFVNPVSSFVAVALMDVWEWTPLITLIALAGLTSMNQSVQEAAALDGAYGWKKLRHITLPAISNVLLVGLLIRTMDAVRYFDIITITTNGGPADATKTAPVRVFETAFQFLDFGYAAVIGIVMLVFTIALARGFVRMLDVRGLAG